MSEARKAGRQRRSPFEARNVGGAILLGVVAAVISLQWVGGMAPLVIGALVLLIAWGVIALGAQEANREQGL